MHGDGVGLQPPVDRGGCREPHGGLYRPRPQGDSWPQRHAHGARDKRGTHHRNSTLQGGTWSLRHTDTLYMYKCVPWVCCVECQYYNPVYVYVCASVCIVCMCIRRRSTHEGEVGGQGHAGVGDLVHGGQLSASPHCLHLFLHRHLHTHIRNVMYTYKYTEKCVCAVLH